MTYTPTTAIEAYAWGKRVGAAALDERTGFYAFEYDPEWIATGRELAPLQMPLTTDVMEFPALSPDTYWRLPALLADSLPDAFGSRLVTHWMRSNGIRSDQITPLDRLAYAADRTMGAITYLPPAEALADASSTLEISSIVSTARAAIEGTLDEVGAPAAIRQLLDVGSSAGGARAKAVIAFDPVSGQMRSGHAPFPAGFQQWLIKLDGTNTEPLDNHTDRLGASAPYGRIEYAYSLMARQAGIHMTECRLLEENGRAHFLTRRFDRTDDGQRLHVATLCAMDHRDFRAAGACSYDEYLDVVTRLGMGPTELEQAFRRMVFNVMAVNRDDHTKNLSFLLPKDGLWQLAPAYDVTHAYNPVGEWTQRHQMSINGRTEGVTAPDLHAVGERHDVPGYRAIVRDVAGAVAAWPEHAAVAAVPVEVRTRIQDDIDELRPRG